MLMLSDPKFANASLTDLRFELLNQRSTKGIIKGLDSASPNNLLYTKPPGSQTAVNSSTWTSWSQLDSRTA
ncbi:hypothetical protein [Kribbella sp. NBC_00359]|uniref:hypothetical protein n=1 Tax=Kribbella sp. NBC_00359 TaxID=2975966 RepID=UPI002E222FFC